MSPGGAPARLDADRVGFWCRALLLAYAAFFAVCGLRGYWPHLADFSMLWAAGRLALAGNAFGVYDWDSIRRLQPFASLVYQFYYPPTFLLVLAPLALLPFTAAAAVWLAATFAGYLAAMRAIAPAAATVLAAAAAPAAVANLISGQNGLLLAALFGGALVLLDARPAVAGLLIGCIAFKPQFGVLLPLFLLVTGRWRVFAAAALALAGLAAGAAAVFGLAPWEAWQQAIGAHAGAFVEQGRLAGRMQWHHLTSLYGMLRVFGAGAVAAWAAQLALALAAAAACLRLAASEAPDALKAAALATAALLATPYSEWNDLTLLLVAAAFVVRDGMARGLGRWEQAALAAVYALPALDLFAPGADFLGMANFAWPIGPAMGGLLAALIGGRLVAASRAGRAAQPAR